MSLCRSLGGAALLSFVFAACSLASTDASRRQQAKEELPKRAATVGDDLLKYVPPDAQALAEIDLARLRANSVVGPAIVRIFGSPESKSGAEPGAEERDLFNVGRDADSYLIASYNIGTKRSHQFSIVQGRGLSRLEEIELLQPDTARIVSTNDAPTYWGETSLEDSVELMAVRTLAMPKRAPGASLRAAARLDFNARVEVSRKLDVEVVPTWLSAWADVADDLAMVVHMGAEDKAKARKLGKAATTQIARLRRFWGSSYPLAARILESARVEVKGETVQVILVVPPKRLEKLVADFLAQSPKEI